MINASKAAQRASMNRALPPALFSGLLAIAADAVIAVDEEQHIIFFNEGAERIFGWRAEELDGQPLELLLPQRFRAMHRGHVQGFDAAHGQARLMGERQEISGQRKSGEEFPCEAAIERIVMDGSTVYAAVLRDISARVRAEKLLHQAIKARDDMMGIVSHDLRNPANAVRMLARSIIEGEETPPLSADVLERVSVIRMAAEQIDALIQDLLDITRLEAGRLSVDRRAVDVSSLVYRSVEAMRPLAKSSGVRLTAELPEDVVRAMADADRLQQLLSNIIGNAIKFTSASGSVALKLRTTDADVLFEIADTGEGIDAAQLPHVFERFFQAGTSNHQGARNGAGLGLPIAHGIVEAHGGRIWIESSPGNGTTVRFTLPRVDSAPTLP
ncbi:MAG: multi-component transcriptional regulator, winged helix family [Gemmatimonadetes bacterium]|nr:multi-component transcriptional regulator, winged helix family [Gemmatimonadota bacterium]